MAGEAEAAAVGFAAVVAESYAAGAAVLETGPVAVAGKVRNSGAASEVWAVAAAVLRWVSPLGVRYASAPKSGSGFGLGSGNSWSVLWDSSAFSERFRVGLLQAECCYCPKRWGRRWAAAWMSFRPGCGRWHSACFQASYCLGRFGPQLLVLP